MTSNWENEKDEEEGYPFEKHEFALSDRKRREKEASHINLLSMPLHTALSTLVNCLHACIKSGHLSPVSTKNWQEHILQGKWWNSQFFSLLLLQNKDQAVPIQPWKMGRMCMWKGKLGYRRSSKTWTPTGNQTLKGTSLRGGKKGTNSKGGRRR